jgi:hypothetical protein
MSNIEGLLLLLVPSFSIISSLDSDLMRMGLVDRFVNVFGGFGSDPKQNYIIN